MVLSENLVLEFQNTFRRKYGEEISLEKAEQELLDLASFIKLILEERSLKTGC